MEPTRDEQIVYLTEWAAKNKAVLNINGEVGFGRECVGILVSDQYVDTDIQYEADAWWEPEDSYHKHDCLCVLGRGDGPLRQLYDWVRWLDEHKYKVDTEYRKPTDHVDLIIHGITRPFLVKDI